MPRTRAHLPVFRLAWLLVAAILFTCGGPAFAGNRPEGGGRVSIRSPARGDGQ